VAEYNRYQRELYRRRGELTLPVGCLNQDPLFKKSAHGFWTLEWLLVFPDGYYVRIWEHYNKIKGSSSSVRHAFSFHYGPTEPGRKPGAYRVGGPVAMRVDKPPDGEPTHLHYANPTQHYQQEHVSGLSLDLLEMFDWLGAVLRHREQRRPLNEVLGFQLKEPA
jgi:hypothetical protein